MAKYRMVRTNFWSNPVVMEEMTPEDRYFYLYLLTNPFTTEIGIYTITKKHMAFDLGYSIEAVHSLMDRFIHHHKLIRYNPETRELAIKNWGKENLHKAGKPIMDCISSELKEVEDLSLISYVADSIPNEEVRSLYEIFCKQEEITAEESHQQEENQLYLREESEMDDTFPTRSTTRGQKEKEEEKENKKEKQQQLVLYPSIDNNPGIENSLQINPKRTDNVKEVVEDLVASRFEATNVEAKRQLFGWIIPAFHS